MRDKQTIQEELRAKLEEQKKLIDLAKTEKRDFSEDEDAKFDVLSNEIRELEKELERAERIEEAEKRAAKLSGMRIDTPKEKKERNFSIVKALRYAVSGKEMPEHIREVHELGLRDIKSSDGEFSGRGIAIPASMVRGVTTVTGQGEETIPTDVKLIEPLMPELTIEKMGADVYTGLKGDLKLAKADGFTFSWVDENEDVVESSTNFSAVSFRPKTIRGKVLLSTKWLAQDGVGAERYVLDLIRKGIDTAYMAAVINGNGVKEPTGILNLANVGVGAATAADWDSVVELESLTEEENGTDNTRSYLMSPKLKGAYKTAIKGGTGSGRFVIEGNELNGYNYHSSSLVPVLGSDPDYKYPLIFGDWKQLKIGQWGGITLLVDPYTKAGAGFVQLIIELQGNAVVVNEKAFAVNKTIAL